MLRKTGKKKSDILPTDLIMKNFYGTTTQPYRDFLVEFTIGCRMTEITFFDTITMYNTLLG